MGSVKRSGERKLRSERTNRKKPELGYYLIVTDTEGTERVYFNGLRDSIQNKIKEKLVLKVIETQNINMLKSVEKIRSEYPQYVEPWLVFDKDENLNFDKLIKEAKELGINVAWSNPCIEIWFSAYFGQMPNNSDSKKCCSEFSLKFKKEVGQEYHKADKNLYAKLVTNGDEKNAIKIAETKFNEHLRNSVNLFSQMVPGTTVHKLISEIKSKI